MAAVLFGILWVTRIGLFVALMRLFIAMAGGGWHLFWIIPTSLVIIGIWVFISDKIMVAWFRKIDRDQAESR